MDDSGVHFVLLSLFQRVLAKDKTQLEIIDSFDGEVFIDPTSACLVFSLIGLHQFISPVCDLTYVKFKQSLYKGVINSELNDLGACIEIFKSTGKVQTNLYQLQLIA